MYKLSTCPTCPQSRKKIVRHAFFPNGHKKNFGPNGLKGRDIKLFIAHRVTELQSDRVTDSQSHTTSTPYTGG